MTLSVEMIRSLTQFPASSAWATIVEHVVELAGKPIGMGAIEAEITKRDRAIGSLDHFLASSGWDLWRCFGDHVERTSDRLAQWWSEPFDAKAVLILDGLSLRELPWLLKGISDRGFILHQARAFASEVPGETNEFARALGFNSRSQLQNDGAGANHRLAPARTESVGMAWHDCANLVDATPNWVFWHHWPDEKLHRESGAGQGFEILSRDIATQLGSKDFWAFVERLATNRRLVITSDHGYAATGLFSDASGDAAQYLKDTFASGRSAISAGDVGPFVPPLAMNIQGVHGPHRLALGRWKWRSGGGYPTLTHGGLSLLEVLSPFVELTT